MKLAFAAAALLFVPFAARAEVLERVAGIVNGQVIALSDVTDRAQLELARVERLPPSEREKARKEALQRALDQLVDERLIESEAATIGVEITPEEENKLVENLAKQNGLSMDQFKEELARQKVDYNAVKDSVKRQGLRSRLLQIKVKPRKVTEEEVKSAYAARAANPEYEVRARHIFVRLPTNATADQVDAARAKIEAALARIVKGDEFAVVARDMSEGPTAKEGGDLGYFKRGMLLPEFDAVASKLQPGQFSTAFKTAAGFHILKIEDKRPLPQRPLPEVQDELRMQLANDSIVQEQVRYLAQLRKSAQVDLRL